LRAEVISTQPERRLNDQDWRFPAGAAADLAMNLILGTRTQWERETPIVLSPEDSRHHTYVIGKTGSGKSTLLRNLILQHLEAGHGVGVIDPHGDLADELLHHLPSRRADDLVYFHPADLEHPIGFNVLARVPRDERHRVVSGIVSAFRNLWPDFWGPRLEYILHHTLAALLECENVTLLGVTRMLTDDRYRAWVVRQVDDPFLRAFWTDEFARYDERFRREAIAPIQNKVGQFLTSSAVRNIVGQVRSRIDFKFMMDSERVFVANLSKGQLGEDKANLLGSLLVTQFQLAAMSRSTLPEAERKPFHLFIDEFQNFTTASFAGLLSEARKFGLCLTLAHQFTAQLSEPVRNAVFGNVGTIAAFRVGHTDAEALAREFGTDFPPSAFVELDRFEVLLRPLATQRSAVPFRMRTLPPLHNRQGNRERLLRRCRERFSTPRGEVERRLARWRQSSGGLRLQGSTGKRRS
jgi:DNA helicase HerA-like ATPase